MDALFRSIPGADAWLTCANLPLGWSSDEKYIIKTQDHQQLLLRVAKEDQFAVKQAEYELIEKIASLPVVASRPIGFGRIEGGVYTLYTYLEGECMEDALPSLPLAVQYALGVEAGRALKHIHSLPASPDAPDWEERMNRKMSRKIRAARECPIEIPGREAMISYIEQHRSLLSGRPQCMQHGDYHCGNLILTPEGAVGVIDFNRFDQGDPWEEFNRIVWCAQTAPAFASGRINGYF